MLMAYAHCAHNVKLGHSVIVANGALLGGYVEVGAQAFVSGNVIIHQFTRVGRLAMVGGGSGLSKDVPPFCTVRPVALNRVAGLNVVGMRRAGLAAEERAAIKRAFTILYRSGLNTTQARLQIQARFQEGPALEFCDFIDTSQRGICAFASEHRRLR
jgi:UDP-N-acetylglucosamine acyltransferase